MVTEFRIPGLVVFQVSKSDDTVQVRETVTEASRLRTWLEQCINQGMFASFPLVENGCIACNVEKLEVSTGTLPAFSANEEKPVVCERYSYVLWERISTLPPYLKVLGGTGIEPDLAKYQCELDPCKLRDRGVTCEWDAANAICLTKPSAQAQPLPIQ